MALHPLVAAVARRQHAVIAGWQAAEHGVSREAMDRLVGSGVLLRPHASVYVVAGSPRTWEQRCTAGVLAAGPSAALSHRSAAALWGVGDPTDLVEVTIPYSRLARVRGVIVHRSRDLAPRWVALRRGIATTNPLMTLLDLGSVVPAGVVEDALDRALGKRLFSVAAAEWAYNDVARPGRRGCGVLRTVLDERALGADPPDGLLEPRMARLLRDHGLPPAEFQHAIGRYRVDFAYPELLIAIEVDGYEAHSTPQHLRDDLRRQNAIVLLGWTILRFSWHDVVRRPGKVACDVRAALGGR